MGIINISIGEVGQEGERPRRNKIVTTDALSVVTAAGYLNNGVLPRPLDKTDIFDIIYSYSVVSGAGTYDQFICSISAAGVVTLSVEVSAGNVLLPVVANHIAAFNGTSGQIYSDPATAINGGNIQAGLSGTAGYLASFPSASAKGSFRVVAVANTGDTLVTLSNALHGQASVYSIPDSGASTANLIISKLTGTQHITVGSLQIDAGSLISGLSTGGQVGTLQLFATTTTTGSIRWLAAANAGAFNVDFTNASHAQSTVYTIADIGAATGGVPVATAAIKMKSVAGAAAAGGAAAQSFSDAFCTSGSNVIGNWNTQANAVSVLKIVPGNGSFVVTSSGDAGVGTFNYLIMK